MRPAHSVGYLCLLSAIALVFAVLWQLLTFEMAPPTDAEQMLQLGEERLRGGDMIGAAEWFTKATEAAPERVEPHLAFGKVQELRGNTEGAIAAYRRATEVEPDGLETSLTLAKVLIESGRNVEAREELQRAKATHPDSIEPLAALASLHLESGNHERAREAFSELESLYPQDPRGALGTAAVEELEGELAVARAAYERATKIDPRLRAPWEGIGRIAAEAGEFSAAERAYRQVVELHPDDGGALVVLGTLVERQERFDDALTLFRRALAKLEDAGSGVRETRALAWTGVGTCLLAKGNHEGAYESLSAALTDDPDQPEAVWALVPIYLERERWSAASDALLTVLPIRSDDAVFWISTGRAEAGQGRWAEARAAFERALEIDGESLDGRRWYGIALRVTGAYRPAEVILHDVVARRPEDDLARLNLAIALGQLGELSDAREQFAVARRLMPGQAEPLFFEAHLLLAHSRVDDALRLAEEAADIAPRDSGALEVLARALLRSGDRARAREVAAAAREAAERSDHQEYLDRLVEQLADAGIVRE